MAKGSEEYWREREETQRQHNIHDEKQYNAEIRKIYQRMEDEIRKEINGFYGKYAAKEGITIEEARRRVSKLDMEEYSRKAKEYVANRDLSPQANEEMRLYNLTMKVNRLEMLKATIGVDMVGGFDDLEKLMGQKLTEKALDEMERQAGILGRTVQNNEEMAHAIVNASFHNAKFSDRIWMYQDMLKGELDQLLSTGLIQGKHPTELARHLHKFFGVSRYDAERLMRTEMARVQTEAQKQSLLANGFQEYEFITVGYAACPICAALDGKHFKLKEMQPGRNAPPMHPNCRCSIAAWMDREVFAKWMDHKYQGGEDSWQEWSRDVYFSSEDSIIKANEGKLKNASPAREHRTQKIIERAVAAPKPIFTEPDDPFGKNASRIPPKPGYYDIVMHGDSDFCQIFGEKTDEKVLMRILKLRDDYHREPIRLLSCYTGAKDNGFAQRLSNLMNVDVEAPDDLIWAWPNGDFVIGKTQYKETGKMILFTPKEK